MLKAVSAQRGVTGVKGTPHRSNDVDSVDLDIGPDVDESLDADRLKKRSFIKPRIVYQQLVLNHLTYNSEQNR